MQTHSRARPATTTIHRAAADCQRADQIDRREYGVVDHVEGRNWKSPLDPDGLRAYGSQPDSQAGTLRSHAACQPRTLWRAMIHSTHARGRVLSHFFDSTRMWHSRVWQPGPAAAGCG